MVHGEGGVKDEHHAAYRVATVVKAMYLSALRTVHILTVDVCLVGIGHLYAAKRAVAVAVKHHRASMSVSAVHAEYRLIATAAAQWPL